MSERDVGARQSRADFDSGKPIDPELRVNLEHLMETIPPPVGEDGHANPEHYRVRLNHISTLQMARLQSGQSAANCKDLREGILEEARLAGLSPERVVTSRSDAAIAYDAARTLLQAEGDGMFELTDQELDALEEAFDTAERYAGQALEEAAADDEAMSPQEYQRRRREVMEQTERGKAWRRRIQRIRVLRRRAREAVPEGTPDDRRDAVDAAHLLRFMCYVGRSNMRPGRVESVFDVHYPAAKMAVAIWIAENWCACVELESGRREYRKGGRYYEGAIIVMPPGHGKSEVAMHYTARRCGQNPYTQGIIGHAKEDKAKDVLQYVAKCFDPDEATGRRCMSLYPRRLADSGNTTSTMRLATRESIKAHTLSCFSIRGKISGSNADFILFDDPVDQAERWQESTRNQTYERINGTWLSRKRGMKSFDLTVTTLWHEDDANSRRIRASREKVRGSDQTKARLRVMNMHCGGPSSVPPFYAIWPEAYPPSYLEGRYHSMSPSEYACYYEGRPMSDADRIVKALSHYDADDDVHARFLETAKFYLSLDPAGTNKASADRAGIIYAAVGVAEYRDADSEKVVHRQKEMRVLRANEERLNQTELVDWCGRFAMNERVDEILVETKSGYVATAEMFKNRYGLDVIRVDPGNKSKDRRLYEASVTMDAVDGRDPPVKFPGRAAEVAGGGVRVVPDERFNFLYQQILYFGATASDASVDAVCYLANRFAPELDIGKGRASEVIRDAPPPSIPPRPLEARRAEYWRRLFERRPRPRADPETEERDFFLSMN